MPMVNLFATAKNRILRKLSYLSEGVYYVSPEELGRAYHRKQTIYTLPRHPYYLREQINSVADVILYVRAAYFRPKMGDLRVKEGDIIWHFNRTGPETICANKGNCGGVSSLFQYLLKDKYEEVGFLAYTDENGGHVFNYVKHDSWYYFIDLLNYLYASKAREHYATMIYQADSLKRYADYYQVMSKKPIKLMVAYTANQVLPIGRRAQEPLMFFPEGVHYEVLRETPQEGIVVKQRHVGCSPAFKYDSNLTIDEEKIGCANKNIIGFHLPEKYDRITLDK